MSTCIEKMRDVLLFFADFPLYFPHQLDVTRKIISVLRIEFAHSNSTGIRDGTMMEEKLDRFLIKTTCSSI